MAVSPEAQRLILRPLRTGDEAEALAADAELASEDFSFLLGPDGTTFTERLSALTRIRDGEGPTATQVPAAFLGAFVDGDLVGRASIRHRLSEQLLRYGGHIGYAVRPQFRRRGFAESILRRSLETARGLGIESALVTGDASNLGSKTVIDRCGGVLDESEEWRMPGKLRFWVPTAFS